MEKENTFEEVPLEADDIKALKDHLQIFLLVFGLIGALISGFIAFLGPLSPDRRGDFDIPQTGTDYISQVLIIFGVSMFIFLLLALWMGRGMYLDLTRKCKLKGRTFIVKKYVDKGTCYFELGFQPVKKLPVKQALFDAYSQGDKVVIEYTKFNKHILKLEKADKIITFSSPN